MKDGWKGVLSLEDASRTQKREVFIAVLFIDGTHDDEEEKEANVNVSDTALRQASRVLLSPFRSRSWCSLCVNLISQTAQDAPLLLCARFRRPSPALSTPPAHPAGSRRSFSPRKRLFLFSLHSPRSIRLFLLRLIAHVSRALIAHLLCVRGSGFDVNEWIVLDSLVRPDVPMVMLNGNLDKVPPIPGSKYKI